MQDSVFVGLNVQLPYRSSGTDWKQRGAEKRRKGNDGNWGEKGKGAPTRGMNPAPLAPAPVKCAVMHQNQGSCPSALPLLHTLLDTQGKRQRARSERQWNVKRRGKGRAQNNKDP